MTCVLLSQPQTSVGSPPSHSLSKKEKNHMKSVRLKQRRRERDGCNTRMRKHWWESKVHTELVSVWRMQSSGSCCGWKRKPTWKCWKLQLLQWFLRSSSKSRTVPIIMVKYPKTLQHKKSVWHRMGALASVDSFQLYFKTETWGCGCFIWWGW